MHIIGVPSALERVESRVNDAQIASVDAAIIVTHRGVLLRVALEGYLRFAVHIDSVQRLLILFIIHSCDSSKQSLISG